MTLSGEEVTSYKFKDDVTLPAAVYKHYDFVGWMWHDQASTILPAYQSFEATGNQVGDIRFDPVFEDFEVTGGKQMTWTSKETPYTQRNRYYYILFYGKEGHKEDAFEFMTSDTMVIKDLDPGTYHYTIKVWCTMEDEEFDWIHADVDDFDELEVPLNEEPVEEGGFVIE